MLLNMVVINASYAQNACRMWLRKLARESGVLLAGLTRSPYATPPALLKESSSKPKF